MLSQTGHKLSTLINSSGKCYNMSNDRNTNEFVYMSYAHKSGVSGITNGGVCGYKGSSILINYDTNESITGNVS